MGMYTELHFNSELTPSAPVEVLDILRCEMAEGNPRSNPVSAEYYRIIDRIAKGEQP